MDCDIVALASVGVMEPCFATGQAVGHALDIAGRKSLHEPIKTKQISLLAPQALVLADAHPLSASGACRRQPQHAECRTEQGKANSGQQGDPRALCGIASQK
jgi:hypothetical protein